MPLCATWWRLATAIFLIFTSVFRDGFDIGAKLINFYRRGYSEALSHAKGLYQRLCYEEGIVRM